MSDRQRHGFVLLLVVGLLAASVFAIATQKTILGLDLKGGVELVYQGEPTPADARRSPRTRSTARSTSCASASTSSASPSPRSRPPAATRSPSGCPTSRTPRAPSSEVGTTAELYFYDWEANVLTPNGKTGRQPAADPGHATRSTISQGRRRPARASRARAGMPLYQAVKLASKQPATPRQHGKRVADRAAVLPVRGARERRLRRGGQARTGRPRRGRPLPARRSRRRLDPGASTSGAAERASPA